MNTLRIVLIQILFLLASGTGVCQTVRVLDLKSGLSNNYVQAILQDKQGYVWIGTRDGLNRYDGYECMVFREELPSTFIYSLMQHSSGEVWIGAAQGGVVMYDPVKERFRSIISESKGLGSLAGKDVYSFYEDHNKGVWICTLQGLARVPASRDTVVWYDLPSKRSYSCTAIAFDSVSRMWVAGTNLGLYRVGKNNTLQDPPEYFEGVATAFIRDIRFTPEMVWIATDNAGVFQFQRSQRIWKQHSAKSNSSFGSDQAWSLYIDQQKQVWASFINGGVFRYNNRSQRFDPVTIREENSFKNASITDVMQDANGNLWVASHGGGVSYFNPAKYVMERYLSGGSGDQSPVIVSSFFEDSNGEILIGTDGAGVKILLKDKRIVNHREINRQVSSNTVLDIEGDGSEGKWLATWQGGVNYVSPNGRVTVFSETDNTVHGLRSNDVKALLKDNSSNLWMASHGQGLAIYNTVTKQFIDPVSIHPSLHREVGQWGSTLLRSSNGDIWIGSHAGLYRYTGTSVEYYTTIERVPGTLASALIYTLFEDSKGQIWVGTSRSLERFVPSSSSFENFTTAYGVPGNVKCILEDSKGRLWISSGSTLVRFDPQTKKLFHPGSDANIQQGQFFECSCLKASDGKMYFGGTEGFNSFWPDSIVATNFSSPVLITDLYLFNKRQVPADSPGVALKRSLPFTSRLELPYDNNVISFGFTTPNFSADKNLYSYKMDGFDKTWSPFSVSRMATYTNLDPGEYTFKVRSVDINNETPGERTLTVVIIPPFWMTWWFKILLAIFVVTLTVGYLLLRLHWSRQKRIELMRVVDARTAEVREQNVRLEQQSIELVRQRDLLKSNNAALEAANNTKDRLFSIIAHDLRNPFASLLGFANLLNADVNKYSDEERKRLAGSIVHASSSIYSLLENLLLWSKSQQETLVFCPEQVTLRTIVLEQFDLVQEVAEKKNVALTVQTGDVGFTADRNMLSIILRNLLFNAVKYSPIGGNVHVGFDVKDEVLSVFVKDEGPGIKNSDELFQMDRSVRTPRDHNHGLGLILCKEFVLMHGGVIFAANNVDKGACFTFTLPASGPTVVSLPVYNTPEKKASSSHEIGTERRDGQSLVLIAEDDDELRWYLKQLLFPDYLVVECEDGNKAMEMTLKVQPDLIISDIGMPGMDGLAYCQWSKQNRETSHIPFLLLTGERGSDKKVTGYLSGADDYITKPIDANVLRARIHSVFENRRRLKEIYKGDITTPPGQFTGNSIDQEFLEKLNILILNRIADPDLNPDSLAREINMSRTGLYMKLKSLTGESVSIYVRNIRLAESKKLLQEKRMNVSEVAYAVGFNQLPYFTTCFKEAFGVTPSEFIAGKSRPSK
jgi:signal transduction histidine kinase/ligand-binding sensor domain-containing protein/DNA-binding response OmpR family regulator